MSELINNRELRQKTIKDIIKQLHEGKTIDEVKAQFEEAWDKVIASGTVSERSELGTPESDAFRAGIYGILQMNENAFEALTEAENDIRERLEELNALNPSGPLLMSLLAMKLDLSFNTQVGQHAFPIWKRF